MVHPPYLLRLLFEHRETLLSVALYVFWFLIEVIRNIFLCLTAYRILRSISRTSYAQHKVQSWISSVTDRAATRINSKMRTEMQKRFKVAKYGRMRDGHPHPEAARERNSATESMHAAVSAMGKRSYVISPSMREKEHDGVRQYYTAADLAQRFSEDPITDDHIIVMTDVDYYADMAYVLSHLRPVYAYTFSPEVAAGPNPEGFFTIRDNHITYRVAGGKTVSHRIWDYSQDHIVTPYRSTSLYYACMDSIFAFFGYDSYANVLTTVDAWRVGANRRVVSLTPIALYPSWLSRLYVGSRLKRVCYRAADGFNALITYGKEHPQISIAREGDVACATLPLARFQALEIAHRSANNKNLSDTARRSALGDEHAPVVHAFLLAANQSAPTEQYFARDASHYTVVTPNPTTAEKFEENKPYARRYASSPLGGCEAVYPYENEENAKASIHGRVTKPQSTSPQYIGSQFSEYAREFVGFVVPDSLRGKGRPMSIDEVMERQNRPTQRVRSAARLWDIIEYFRVKAMQKREAYTTPNDPRNISTVPTMHTLRLSGYTYEFKTMVLKGKSWYVPCMSPAQIAESVRSLAANSPCIRESDFSRFDGHITEFLRTQVERACYMRWVHPDHAEDFGGLFDDELHAKARHGRLAYKPKCSRLSGSPLTTDGNTIINAFYQYCVSRTTRATPREAYDNIGLVCGDDGLQRGDIASNESCIRTAAKLGLKLTVEKLAQPGQTVSFLSRVFKDPWTTPASIQDPKRSLAKIHTTVDTTVPIESAGQAKATGYLITDPTTPFISQWCRCYLRNVGTEYEISETGRDIPYFASSAEFKDSPWPSEDGFEGIVADKLGISAGELQDHLDALDAYTGPVDSIPQLEIPKDRAKVDAVVDGEIHRAGTSTSDMEANQHGNHGKQQSRSTCSNQDSTEVPKGSVKAGNERGSVDNSRRSKPEPHKVRSVSGTKAARAAAETVRTSSEHAKEVHDPTTVHRAGGVDNPVDTTRRTIATANVYEPRRNLRGRRPRVTPRWYGHKRRTDVNWRSSNNPRVAKPAAQVVNGSKT